MPRSRPSPPAEGDGSLFRGPLARSGPRPDAGEPAASTPGPHRSARDRHGRGLRGPLAPPDVPLSRSRSQRFDELVLDLVERVDRRLPQRLADVEFAVEDVPSLQDWTSPWVPLARTFPGIGDRPTRVVVYRRPVETRAQGISELRALVRDVVVEELAEVLGLAPEDIDPEYGEEGPAGPSGGDTGPDRHR